MSRGIQKTAATAILERLAAENRRVLSDWRALIFLRRATLAIPRPERRWSRMPEHPLEIHPILRQMATRDLIAPLPRLPGIYEVTAPYANSGLIDEHEVVMEANPYCAVSHLSALVYHGLTDDLPKVLTVTVPIARPGDLFPPGTSADDWEDLTLAPARRPARILERRVHWTRVKLERYFGTGEYHRQGFPVRVTDRERTLLDGLQDPALSGGVQNVLRAWVAARDVLDPARVIQYADRLGIAVLRQRAGFVLEELGLSHPRLAAWRQTARRGGSSKLLGSAPYSTLERPQFSEAWNLSLNAPIDVLRGGQS